MRSSHNFDQASRWAGLHGRVALHADHRGSKQQQDDLVARYLRCGLTRRIELKNVVLSLFRRMDDRYFVYDDRWRIVAYVRALQLSQGADVAKDIPPGEKQRVDDGLAGKAAPAKKDDHGH